jgi:hypothetical protein
MTDQTRRWAASLLFTLTAGCATVPPPQSSDAVTIELPAGEVRARIERSLHVRGMALLGSTAGPAPITAMSTGPLARGWATCPTLTMVDPSRRTNRRSRTDVRDVTTSVTVSIAEAGPAMTRVAVRTTQLGTYINPFTNNPTVQACTSTGQLEREILDALRLG